MGFCQALVTVGGSWPFAYCISVNRLQSLPAGATSLSIPLAMSAYIYTGIFVTVPSMASVFNEYALKSQFNTSIYLQPESERKLSLASSFDYRYLSSCSILSDSLYNCEYAGLKLIGILFGFTCSQMLEHICKCLCFPSIDILHRLKYLGLISSVVYHF